MIKKITRLAIVLISICIYVWKRNYVDHIPLIIMIVLFWLNVITLFKVLTKGWENSKKFAYFVLCADVAWSLYLLGAIWCWFTFTVPIISVSIGLGMLYVGLIVWGIYTICKGAKDKKKSNIIQFPRRSGK